MKDKCEMATKKSGFQKQALKFGKREKRDSRRPRPASGVERDPAANDSRRTSKVTPPRSRKPMGELSDLLQRVAEMYVSVKSEKKLLFALGYKKGMWQFEVVNSWQLWFERSLPSEFRASTPEAAVQAFLSCVASRKLNPASLTSPD